MSRIGRLWRSMPRAGRPRPAASRQRELEGPGFGRLVALTALGALLPGSGLRAAGRRVLGGVVLMLVVAAVVGLGLLVATGRITDTAIYVAVRPDLLAVIGVGIPVLATAWCGVIVGSHFALRCHPLSGWQRVLAALLVVFLCVPVIAVGIEGARYAFIQRALVANVFGAQPVPPVPPAPQAPSPIRPPTRLEPAPWQGASRLNVLLLGSDAGQGRIGTRPDSIIVASIDTHTGRTVLLSLPRNLQNVPFPPGSPVHALYPEGYNCGDQCLLNAVWRNVGEAHRDLFPGDENPGLTATAQAVEATLGLELDHYVLVNLRGFVKVIDALGGVKVNVHQTLVVGDPAAPLAVIQPGEQHLDGWHALWFARVRQGSDDYDRMRRQRCLIGSIIDQGRNPLRLIRRLPSLAEGAEATIRTDMPHEELPAFVSLVRRIRGAEVTSLAFTDQVINPGDPDFATIRRLTRRAIEATEPATQDPGTPDAAKAEPLTDLC